MIKISLPWQENVDSDQFHRDIEWDLGSTDYEPATGAYVAPWDRQGWGGNDVVLTPPRTSGGYVPPSSPAIQEGQRDYVYMPTEKEQWRIGDENKRRQAAAVGKDWKESRLPRPVPEEPKEKVYPDWREAIIQPIDTDRPDDYLDKDWRDVKLPTRDTDAYEKWKPTGRTPLEKDGIMYAGGSSPIRGVSGHDYVNKPEYREHRETRRPRRASLRDTLVGAMRRSWR